MKKYFIVLLFSLLSFSGVYGQIVGKVTFQQQKTFRFSDDILIMNTQTKEGLPLSERVINSDVRRLFEMGIFSDISTEIRDMEDGRKEVVFLLSPKPIVDTIKFSGNEKFTEKKLLEQINLKADVPLNDSLLSEAVENLRKFYRSKGMTSTDVIVRLLNQDESITVEFVIKENLRVRIDNVLFENMTVYQPSEVKSELETRYFFPSVSWLSWFPSDALFGVPPSLGLLDQEAIERDKLRLRELYWRKGYLDFEVKEVHIVEREGNPELVDVTFVLDEGEPYTIRNVEITGAKQFEKEELLSALATQKDNTYSLSNEENDLKLLEGRYAPLGYADFNVSIEKLPDYSTHTIDLAFHITEGKQYTVNEIYIAGNKWTKDHVIRRELAIEQDDLLDKDLMEISKSRLLGMGYFASQNESEDGVDIVAVDSPVPGKKDIIVKVEEKRFISGSIGAGWSDSDGLAGSIQIEHTNMDIFDPKNYFTGGGQRLRIAALVGIEHFDVQANFTEPYLFGIPLRLDLSGYWRQVMYDDWDERRLGFTVSLTKRIFDDFTSITGGYTFEQVGIVNMDKKLSERFTESKGYELMGKVFLSLNRDTRDNAFNPKSGYDVGIFTSFASKALGGSHDYYKVELHGINYFPFINNWFVLTTGVKVGMTGPLGGGRVPLYDRYFLGGGDSVRGFPYRSIGPEDGNNDNYGGEFMYLVKVELSHPIYKDFLRGAAFVDVGDVTAARFGPISNPNIGVGYGLRIMVPGLSIPLRLDLAYPVLSSQDGVSKKLRFHFNVGFSL